VRAVVRTYFPPLPRSVTTLQVGGLVNFFGNGITLPFLTIYLHNVHRDQETFIRDFGERLPAGGLVF
jgi:hypothetical protein